MEYRMVVISTSSAGIEPVSNLLIINGIGGFEVCDSEDFKEFLSSHVPAYDYIDESLESLCSQRSTVKFYTAVNSQGDGMIRAVEASLAAMKAEDAQGVYGTLELNVTDVDDSEWRDNWKKYYHPMEIGDSLTVVPAWESIETDRKVLRIDPGMAFGTGSHETTSLCLELLQEYGVNGKRVMDVGCGSGILSQAAALLGADFACGCDIDEAAVTTAVANARLNGLEGKTAYYRGDLLELADGKYDIVVANIVADIIKKLTCDIGTVLIPNGLFISSGIIKERADEVSDYIKAHGFEILQLRERRGWVAIAAIRK